MSLGEDSTTRHELQNTSKKLFLRVRITISCRMNFDDYPLDAHTCQFQVGSCKSLTQKRTTPEVIFITDYDTKDMVTCTAKFIYDLKRQRSLQHFLTIEDLPEQFHTVVIPSGDPCHHHGQVYFEKNTSPEICILISASWDIYSLSKKIYRRSQMVTAAQKSTFS